MNKNLYFIGYYANEYGSEYCRVYTQAMSESEACVTQANEKQSCFFISTGIREANDCELVSNDIWDQYSLV